MSFALEKHDFQNLSAEWERIGLLGYLLSESRQGHQAPPDLLDRIKNLQRQVEQCRWEGQGLTKRVSMPLSPMELDILACVIAPEAEPRLGWLFQTLQPGISQPYPTMAFLQELLAIAPKEISQFYSVFTKHGALRHLELIEIKGDDPYQPIRPAAGVTSRLLGRPLITGDPPGATLVKIKAGWNDLILPPDRLAMLHEFLMWITHKAKVVQEWGGEDCGGPVALFSGPSGTGKTFSAAVLATELGWPLYRVDLGCLVSKYIGETEKNLNRLFDAAHGQPMILQFDEADSLFSKRGEVKEARDRYANMEVSHLLARIESHQGPVILTTNLRRHLDQAFARRFQVVVDFPRPDAKARTLLWQRLIPPGAPGIAEVNTTFLGEAVNLTGGNIRNAALHAAYLAAGNGQRLSMQHVTLAIWRELGKDGRELSKADLGTLAPYMPEKELC
jgi:hypothetical protein